jgi:UDP-glucose 4-epimerase
MDFMNVFVIGGDGYLGAHVCRKFLREGHQVTIFGPGMQQNFAADIAGSVQWMEGDIVDAPSLFQALMKAKPDRVIHLAAFGAGKDGLAKSAQRSPRKAIDVNITGFYHVLEAVRTLGISRMIWSGSTTVFGHANLYPEERIKEDAMVSPTTMYGSTKVMDELMSRIYREQYGLEIVCLRLPLIYGPGKWYKGAAAAIVDLFEQSVSEGETIIRCGNEPLDLMYVEDMADAFYLAAMTDSKLDDIYHLISHTISIPDLAAMVKKMIPDYRLKLEISESAMIYPLIDTSKIERDMGFVPRFSAEEACKHYLERVWGRPL